VPDRRRRVARCPLDARLGLGRTPTTESNDPDWTAGTLVGKTPDDRYFIADHRRDRQSPAGVERIS
jgi:phage terminase large subunit-like protein